MEESTNATIIWTYIISSLFGSSVVVLVDECVGLLVDEGVGLLKSLSKSGHRYITPSFAANPSLMNMKISNAGDN